MRKKPETWWCIASGTMLLPFTARATRNQAVFDRTESQGYTAYQLPDYERVVKIEVTPAKRRSQIRRQASRGEK